MVGGVLVDVVQRRRPPMWKPHVNCTFDLALLKGPILSTFEPSDTRVSMVNKDGEPNNPVPEHCREHDSKQKFTSAVVTDAAVRLTTPINKPR